MRDGPTNGPIDRPTDEVTYKKNSYIKSPNPNRSIQKLAEFTLRGYGARWFLARMKSGILDTPRLMFRWIKTISQSDSDIFEIVKPVLENGSYWFHSENLLLSILGDSRDNAQKRAIDRILQIRNDAELKKKIHNIQVDLKRKKKVSIQTTESICETSTQI